MARKTNGELLNNIDKTLAIVATNVAYLKEGHANNFKKIEKVDTEIRQIGLQLSKGAGKIKLNRENINGIKEDIGELSKDVNDKFKDVKINNFRMLDVVFAVFMIILSVLSIFK